MTREGSTPFLQSPFRASIKVLGRTSSGGSWQVLEDGRDNDSQGDWYVFYGSWRESGIEQIKVEVRSFGLTGLEPYVKNNKEVSILEAGLLIIGTESRERKFIPGSLSFDKKKKELVVLLSEEFDVTMLAGNYEIEPVIVVKTDVLDPRKNFLVTAGTVVGFSQALRLKPSESLGLLEDLFDFVWLKFSEVDNREVVDGDLFDLDIEGRAGRPVVYLNEVDEYSSFRGVMERSNPATGKPSKEVKVRRALDSFIAAAILEAAGAVIVNRIREVAALRWAEDPAGPDFSDIFDELTENEKQIIDGYIELFSRGGADESSYSFCEDMATLPSQELKKHLESVMPRQIRRAMGAQDAVQNMLDLADLSRPGN